MTRAIRGKKKLISKNDLGTKAKNGTKVNPRRLSDATYPNKLKKSAVAVFPLSL